MSLDAPTFHRRRRCGLSPAHVDRGGPPHRYPGGPLEITKLHVGPYENNAYLLRDPETNDALLVDVNEAERLVELLEVALAGIVTTHRHLDHISALAGVLKVHDVWNGAHPADAGAIADQVSVTPDRVLEHGDTLTVGRRRHRPAHPRAHRGQHLLQAAVQPGADRRRPVPGRGRQDRGPRRLRRGRSAEQHLLSLPGRTRISPGHGDDTQVEREVPQLDEWKARGW